MGAVTGATFSGYIVEKVSWTVQFWYNVGFEGAIALLMFLFVDETLWPHAEQPDIPLPPANPVSRRMATYLFTQRLTRKQTKDEVIQSITLQFLITISPVTILIGSTLMIFYGWGIAMNTFLSIFLQNPLEEGGYGFSPERNASCEFHAHLAGSSVRSNTSKSPSSPGSVLSSLSSMAPCLAIVSPWPSVPAMVALGNLNTVCTTHGFLYWFVCLSAPDCLVAAYTTTGTTWSSRLLFS